MPGVTDGDDRSRRASERSGSVARAAAVLGDVAFTMDDGEPVFAEPWEGRAFAMAVDLVARTGRPWDDFRAHLVAAVTAEPHRPYYESWVVALEALARDEGVSPDELDRRQEAAGSYRYHEDGLGDVEVHPLRPEEWPGHVGALGACCHVERYRTWVDGGPGPWRLRAFDADDVVMLDGPLPTDP